MLGLSYYYFGSHLLTLLLRFSITFLLAISCSSIYGADKIRIGVLSFRSIAQTQQQWSGLSNYLEQHIPEHTFELVPLFYPDLDRAAVHNELDFVLTNPEHYVLLRQQSGLAAIATLMPLVEGHPVNQFGGVIFSLATRQDIQILPDLANKKIAAPAEESFGGFLMQRWELNKRDIKPASFKFTGMPHDLAVDEVLKGNVDAGFVRSGILESMIIEGKVAPDALKIINQQNPVVDFPNVISTPLYPEWPFSATTKAPQSLIKAVSLALLNMDKDDLVAKTAKIYGFTPPSDYTEIEAVMLRLHVHPQTLKNVNLIDIYYSYRYAIWITTGLLLIIAILTFKLLRSNRRMHSLLLKMQKSELELRLHDTALNSCADAIIITNIDLIIQWANPAFCILTGYSLEETLGHKVTKLLNSGQQSPSFYDQLRDTILAGHTWRGELVNRRKNGDLYDEQLSITPVYGSQNHEISHFIAIKQDISERKSIEAKIKQLAFYDPLTHLANRRLLIDRLEHTLATCRRTRQFGALLYIDLDHFKPLNDQYGHDVGDQLLIELAKRLKQSVRGEDTVARIGGDEFVVLLIQLNTEEKIAHQQVIEVATKIHEVINQPYTLKMIQLSSAQELIEYSLTASIGITLFKDDQSSGDKILKQADIAMYQAKHAGRDTISSFTNEEN